MIKTKINYYDRGQDLFGFVWGLLFSCTYWLLVQTTDRRWQILTTIGNVAIQSGSL